MLIREYNLPDDLHYTQDHGWVKAEDGRIRIGITDVMQGLAGRITFIRIPRVGKVLEKGKTLASLQSGKWAGRIAAPMGGVVVEANTLLTSNPGLLNSSPYDQGWIAVMVPTDLATGLAGLVSGSDVEPWLSKELAAHDV